MRVRRVLMVLASRKVVDLLSNRGAFVASPSAEEAREIFDARRAIEPSVARRVARQITSEQLSQLKEHTQREHEARTSNNRHEAIRLSGEFHVQFAEFGGNSVLLHFVEELVMRTSLIIGLFGAAGISNCADDEHYKLLDAVAAGDEMAASDLMITHLDHIESELELDDPGDSAVDIRNLFGA